MKTILSVFILMFIHPLISVGQTIQRVNKNDYDTDNWVKPGRTLKPLTSGAFDKFLTDHFSYTILGSLTPATGLKVETSSPSVALKGTLIKNRDNWFISTLELQAGADGKAFQVFSDNKTSTYFKATVGFYFLPGSFIFSNKAKYLEENKYWINVWRTNAASKYLDLKKQLRRASIQKAMLSQAFLSAARTDKSGLTAVIGDINVSNAPDYEELIRETLAVVGLNDPTEDINVLLSNYTQKFTHYTLTDSTNLKNLLAAYKRNDKLKKRGLDSLYRFEIAQVSDLWTSKTLRWISVLPYIGNTNYTYYETDPIRLRSRHSFLYGGKIAWNYYRKYKEAHRYAYLTIGLTPQKMNSIDEMTKFSYKKSTSEELRNPANALEKEVVSKEETGTAYQGYFDSGFGMEYFLESYFVLWRKDYIPGIYFKSFLNSGKHRINTNRIGAYLGLVWNVSNTEKDSKNLLTIVPYAGFSNFNRQYETVEKTDPRALHSLFTAGIQIGVPINLGK